MGNIRLKKNIIVIFLVSVVIIGCSKKDTPSTTQTPLSGVRSHHEPKKSSQDLAGSSIPVPVKQLQEFDDYAPHKRAPREIVIECKRLAQAPTIDGLADESFWNEIDPIETLDFSCQRPIELRCFHDGVSIYFLVSYPDSAPSESHKSWLWDSAEKVYKPCNDREDMFVLKWLMTGENLSFSSDLIEPHTADIWFWKARRTNPVGYFDDKSHIVSKERVPDAVAIKSDKHGTLYLTRPGDAGKSAYEERIFFEYQGDCLRKYYPRTPEGSRADIAGKGVWNDGRWTIEIQRKLRTGHDDDIQLEVGGQYVFAATLYEMSASPIEDYWYQPLYKTGNAFDRLILNLR